MQSENYPFVSIILPIRNEAIYTKRGLLTITEQDYPAERMEILIADGMSTDDTRSQIQEFSISCPTIRIQILDNPGRIVPIGMNIALRQAKGEIIIRVDGHTVISPDYVRQCVRSLQRTHADNVGGKMDGIGAAPFGKAVAICTSTTFGIGGGLFHYSDKEEWVDTVYMGAWPRQIFERIGLFDEELVRDQDDEFNYRLREHGGRILLCPSIKSKYMVRSTPKTLWKQYYQYGFWKVRVLQKHPKQMSLRQFVPVIFVLALIGSILFAFFPLLRPLSSVIPSLYLIVNLLVSTFTACKRGREYLPFLPLIYAILHLSYGIGFLLGLIMFAKRWGDRTGNVPVFHPNS
jgi:succinoglycan biosynthesis protein ExoA